VSFSPALKLLLAVFLPLTLFWKLTVQADNSDHAEDDVMTFLARHGFHAAATEDITFRGTWVVRGIRAVNSACSMRIMMPSYYGADRDIMRDLVTADDNLIYVHHGRVYQEQPILLTLSAELWGRALRKIGVAYRHIPVLAVVAQHQCDADRLPWDELQSERESPSSKD
jgi:hypothetical protein